MRELKVCHSIEKNFPEVPTFALCLIRATQFHYFLAVKYRKNNMQQENKSVIK